MRHAANIAFLVVNLAFLLAATAHWSRQRGYDEGFTAGVASVPAAKAHKPDLDATCSAWLFSTNLKRAKQKICGRH